MTYHRIFETHSYAPKELSKFKEENDTPVTEDRIRCQHCHGFYWRLWFDVAQCLACQHYAVLQVGKPVNKDQLTFNFVELQDNLLRVVWIRAQLTSKETGEYTKERVKDPLTGRTEFIIFADRLRCRVTGNETLITPQITAFWLLDSIPKVKGKVLTAQEALQIVKQKEA